MSAGEPAPVGDTVAPIAFPGGNCHQYSAATQGIC